MKSGTTLLKIGHARSKTRSLGQILGKTCACSRGLIFSPIPMKLGQNVCLSEDLDKFENGSYQVKKTRLLGKILKKKKTIVHALEARFSV